MFKAIHRVHFYETDVMGIVHHSNFLRIFEEARMSWLKNVKLHLSHAPYANMTFAVLETHVKHLKPAYLDEELTTYIQVRSEKAKIRFGYATVCESKNQIVATGETLHVALDKELKILRIPFEFLKVLESQIWTETWPLNLLESLKPQR